MEQVCHRCGAALNGSDTFCPHCGAPQLVYESGEEAGHTASSTPGQRRTAHDPSAVHWREAITFAALVAVPAGVLAAILGLEALWGIAGGMTLISLYRRRTGTLPTGKMGWRIGALLGVLSAAVAVLADAVVLTVQRFALHEGTMLDHRYKDLGQQLIDQLTRSNPDAAAVVPGFLHFWMTPNGAAAIVLINAAGVAIFLLLFASIGGALGARLTQRSAQTSVR